jgi:hypothetical protein
MSFETMKVFNEVADNADMNALLGAMLQAKVWSSFFFLQYVTDELLTCNSLDRKSLN